MGNGLMGMTWRRELFNANWVGDRQKEMRIGEMGVGVGEVFFCLSILQIATLCSLLPSFFVVSSPFLCLSFFIGNKSTWLNIQITFQFSLQRPQHG